ncbi:hypothetical protein K437DRAFT_62916 [Tilletiaria anomala UBC 951]|uniref:Uncharacterized protein n=1 Tax=Tilletiaria anomala (strain ATCC 24038 / CBS 436.72 / UBC 951) TaxID=1037660 RepID=A0A066V3P6_TILAU|nr:uncharacterized protein K437DRAFT_62916 [Tilletiaria anomala UBC 951]KDN36096.1 hypothetical protein K437DRAFT_62916 [Tilletiaria anomala UBC 951]
MSLRVTLTPLFATCCRPTFLCRGSGRSGFCFVMNERGIVGWCAWVMVAVAVLRCVCKWGEVRVGALSMPACLLVCLPACV